MSDQPTSIPHDLVPVQVPRHLLTAVYAFIAEHDGRPPEATEESPLPEENEEVSTVPRVSWRDWTIEDFGLLLRDRRPSTARVIKVLDVLAAHPDTEYSTTKLAEATGLSRGELSGGFSGFTRVCRSLREGVRMDWPILWNFGPSINTGQGSETYYYLPEILAQRWGQARSQ